MQNRSIKELEQLSEENNVDAQINLAWKYQYGIDVDKNIQEAIRLYRLAIHHESAIAEYNLAYIYCTESDVNQDNNEAIRLFKLASEKGSSSAQFFLGCLYRDGKIVQKDDIEAIRLFRLSADANDSFGKMQLQTYFSQYPKIALTAYHAALTFFNSIPIVKYEKIIEELVKHPADKLASLFYQNPKDISRIHSLLPPKLAEEVQNNLNDIIRKDVTEFIKHIPDDTQLPIVLLNIIFEYINQYTVPTNPRPKFLAFFEPKEEMTVETNAKTLESKTLSLK